MCGILGIVNLENKSRVELAVARKMLDTMTHRGPDAGDVYIDHQVALGNRRLSIIDLSAAGNQPMVDANETAVLVTNAEIYNYREIRELLLAKGYQFRSQTDTEVLLNAYLEWGIACLEKLIGMFAFAIYDKTKNAIYIVRDRLGIKPLFYSFYDGKLIFASEIKAILNYPAFRFTPSNAGISSYLSYRYPIDEYTMFNEVKSLRPGYYLQVDLARATHHSSQYWDLPSSPSTDDLGEDFYIQEIRDRLLSSVRYRMISDVSIGAYLSGGLDSSIIVSLMAKLSQEPVKTFTIGFEEDEYNEFRFAKLVADRYQTDHHEILLSSEQYIQNMIRLIKFKDAPLGIANEPALYVMSKELKQYITVVLSGEGADEIFGGYGRIFRSPFDFMRMRELSGLKDLNGENACEMLRQNLEAKYAGRKFSSELSHFLFLYQYINWEDKERLLSNDFLHDVDNDNMLTAVFDKELAKIEGLNSYQKYMWLFEKIHIVGLLQRVDITTMATSVEARVPFVDHRLVEFALSIPIEYKLKWKSLIHQVVGSLHNCDEISEKYDIPKYILKKSFDDDLPSEVVWRKKMGFPVPVHKWFGEDFNALAHDLLLDSTAKSRGLYNHKHLEQVLSQKSLFSDHSFGLKIWMLVNLELWYREYIDQSS